MCDSQFMTAPRCQWISWACSPLLMLPGKVRRLVWGDNAGIILGVINVYFILKRGIATYSSIVLKNDITVYIIPSYYIYDLVESVHT